MKQLNNKYGGNLMKPKILISRCLGFDNCRYNGDMITFNLLKNMKEKIEFIPVCPEVEIGLPVPRESLRLVKTSENIDLVQPYYRRYLTKEMEEYSDKVLEQFSDVDGFILKGRSPSCGIKDVKVYSGMDKSPVIEKSEGIFAKEVYKRFSCLPIEEEGRLMNLMIREHFFTKLYVIFSFKNMIQNNSMKEFSEFHAKNKYLYFAYDQTQKNKLGIIVANHGKQPFNLVAKNYLDEMSKLFSKLPSQKNYINAFQHIFGYFSKYISKEEKKFILNLIDKYRKNQIYRSSITSVLKSYSIKYKLEYLLNQSIFQPFPEELVILDDSGKY